MKLWPWSRFIKEICQTCNARLSLFIRCSTFHSRHLSLSFFWSGVAFSSPLLSCVSTLLFIHPLLHHSPPLSLSFSLASPLLFKVSFFMKLLCRTHDFLRWVTKWKYSHTNTHTWTHTSLPESNEQPTSIVRCDSFVLFIFPQRHVRDAKGLLMSNLSLFSFTVRLLSSFRLVYCSAPSPLLSSSLLPWLLLSFCAFSISPPLSTPALFSQKVSSPLLSFPSLSWTLCSLLQQTLSICILKKLNKLRDLLTG